MYIVMDKNSRAIKGWFKKKPAVTAAPIVATEE
jgi:hypothetical protein